MWCTRIQAVCQSTRCPCRSPNRHRALSETPAGTLFNRWGFARFFPVGLHQARTGETGSHINRLRGVLPTGTNTRPTLGPQVHCMASDSQPDPGLPFQREYTRNREVEARSCHPASMNSLRVATEICPEVALRRNIPLLSSAPRRSRAAWIGGSMYTGLTPYLYRRFFEIDNCAHCPLGKEGSPGTLTRDCHRKAGGQPHARSPTESA